MTADIPNLCVHRALREALRSTLDQSLATMLTGDGYRGTRELIEGLESILDVTPTALYPELAELCAAHPLNTLLLEDPYTARC